MWLFYAAVTGRWLNLLSEVSYVVVRWSRNQWGFQGVMGVMATTVQRTMPELERSRRGTSRLLLTALANAGTTNAVRPT